MQWNNPQGERWTLDTDLQSLAIMIGRWNNPESDPANTGKWSVVIAADFEKRLLYPAEWTIEQVRNMAIKHLLQRMREEIAQLEMMVS